MKTSLLRRFRWPIVIAFVSGIVLMCIAAVVKMNDDSLATVGVCLFVGSFAVAAVLNGIDESPKTIAEKYNQE